MPQMGMTDGYPGGDGYKGGKKKRKKMGNPGGEYPGNPGGYENPGNPGEGMGETSTGNQRMLGAMGGIMASGLAKKKRRPNKGQSMQSYQG